MSSIAPQAENLPKESAEPGGSEGSAGPATDEDILRLRARLDREFAVVAQKLSDAEASMLDIEIALRACESGPRTRLPGAPPGSSEKGTDRITSRFRAVGDGLSKLKDWVVKPGKEGESPEAAASSKAPLSDPRPASKGSGDLEDRLEYALRSFSGEIREREREATELDRKLHDAQKELVRLRAGEQEAREKQVKYNQNKQLREDLERKLSQLNESVRTIETSMKTDTELRQKAKEPAAPSKSEDPMQAAIDEAHKAVAAQEKKVADLEKDLDRANAGLVEERARQQRIRGMQIRLRQARYFSTDLQRALSGLASTLDDFRHRAGGLLRPDAKAPREKAKAPGHPSDAAAEAPAPKGS